MWARKSWSVSKRVSTEILFHSHASVMKYPDDSACNVQSEHVCKNQRWNRSIFFVLKRCQLCLIPSWENAIRKKEKIVFYVSLLEALWNRKAKLRRIIFHRRDIFIRLGLYKTSIVKHWRKLGHWTMHTRDAAFTCDDVTMNSNAQQK